jgi:hypothetical protein
MLINGREEKLVFCTNAANAYNIRVVEMAAFLRAFAQKMTALPRLCALICYEFYTTIKYILVFGEQIMTKNTSMTLGDHFDAFIAHQIEIGRYSSASKVVRAGL